MLVAFGGPREAVEPRGDANVYGETKDVNGPATSVVGCAAEKEWADALGEHEGSDGQADRFDRCEKVLSRMQSKISLSQKLTGTGHVPWRQSGWQPGKC